jgi:RHS repeat-associated protein
MGNWKNTVYTPVGGSPTTEVRRHNLVNELTKFGSTPVTYDNGNNRSSSNPVVSARGNGNIYRDGTNQYEYDAFNRIVDVNRLSDLLQTALYSYDALGRRVTKTVFNGGLSGTITNATYRYLYDGDQIIEELLVGEATTTLRQFVWGQYIDELIQLMTYADTGTQPLPAGSYYPLQDLLYRTIALTASDGTVVEAYDYDAYGNTLMFRAAGGVGHDDWWADDCAATLQPACEYLFTGRQYDPETEIYWYRWRYYNPRLGRFAGRDHSDSTGASNFYLYVGSAPTANVDPSGWTQINLLAPTTVPVPTTKPTTQPTTEPYKIPPPYVEPFEPRDDCSCPYEKTKWPPDPEKPNDDWRKPRPNFVLFVDERCEGKKDGRKEYAAICKETLCAILFEWKWDVVNWKWNKVPTVRENAGFCHAQPIA